MSEQQKRRGRRAVRIGCGTGAGAQTAPVRKVRTHHLREMKERGEKITMLTAYDMYTAATFDEAGIDLLLVGDSASNNVSATRPRCRSPSTSSSP